jgi:hypothetical protein
MRHLRRPVLTPAGDVAPGAVNDHELARGLHKEIGEESDIRNPHRYFSRFTDYQFEIRKSTKWVNTQSGSEKISFHCK